MGIIKNNCNSIKILKMSEQNNQIPENRTYIIDKENKEIIAYPIERKVLYAIAKIGKKEKIIKDNYFLIDETISNLINTGNNIHMVEPLRDFNGYSWTTIPQEIESIDHNLIYQNLRILVGHKFLNKWIRSNEFMIDYFEEFKEEFEKYLSKIEVMLNEKQYNQFYKYMNLLIEWNKKINLTAIIEPKEIILKHFVDSHTIAKYIKQNQKMIDVGTGAGFPGIPLKIYCE